MKTISELAAELGVTLRTIRFYEERGIIKPHREGRMGSRYFDDAAVARMKEVLRLKRYGFTLLEIKRSGITRERLQLRFHQLLEEIAEDRKAAGELEAELNAEAPADA